MDLQTLDRRTRSRVDAMKCIIVQVAVGEVRPLYEKCMLSVQQYCQRHGYEYWVIREPILKVRPQRSCRSANALRLGYLPIYEKQNALGLLEDYERVAVIDADVYIRDTAPDIFEELHTAHFAAVPERRMPVIGPYAKKLDGYEVAQYGPLKGVGLPFLQMGVMVFGNALRRFLNNQTPREFLRRPEFQPFINGEGAWRWSTDQTLMNWWIRSAGVKIANLDWKWNALYGVLQPGCIREAHFVHFFLADRLPSQDPVELLKNSDYVRPRV